MARDALHSERIYFYNGVPLILKFSNQQTFFVLSFSLKTAVGVLSVLPKMLDICFYLRICLHIYQFRSIVLDQIKLCSKFYLQVILKFDQQAIEAL